jgi:hypothetical protein
MTSQFLRVFPKESVRDNGNLQYVGDGPCLEGIHRSCTSGLPAPHSPDLNPIEMALAELKALLRKAAQRSIENLRQTIGTLLNEFTAEECANFFRHARYDPA